MDQQLKPISAAEAASRFPTDIVDSAGLIILNDEEVRGILIGHELRSNNSVVAQELFKDGGKVYRIADLGVSEREDYVIVDGVICITLGGPPYKTEKAWACRRLYRDKNGRLFELWEGERDLRPVEII